MSRVGNKAIPIPASVSISIESATAVVKGKFGDLTCPLPKQLNVVLDRSAAVVRITRSDDSPSSRSLHGLIRTLISNMVIGVDRPWEKRLEIVGVGYQASLSGNVLTLSVGYANPLRVSLPKGVTCVVSDPTHLVLSSADKQLVGQLAANVRSLRVPEPYKGKGIRYSNETVRRKSGKAFGS